MLKSPNDRWATGSNNRHGRYRRKKAVEDFRIGQVKDPIYVESIAGDWAIKITQALIDEVKTRWLINPVPQQFKAMGMVYHANQIRSIERTRYLYLDNGAAMTIVCVNPKRGVWKVYLKQA